MDGRLKRSSCREVFQTVGIGGSAPTAVIAGQGRAMASDIAMSVDDQAESSRSKNDERWVGLRSVH